RGAALSPILRGVFNATTAAAELSKRGLTPGVLDRNGLSAYEFAMDPKLRAAALGHWDSYVNSLGSAGGGLPAVPAAPGGAGGAGGINVEAFKRAIGQYGKQGRQAIDEAYWNDTVASNKAAENLKRYYRRNPLNAYKGAAKQARKRAQNVGGMKAPKGQKQGRGQFVKGQKSAVKQLKAQNLAHANMLGALARNENAEQQARMRDAEQFRQFNNAQLTGAHNAALQAQRQALLGLQMEAAAAGGGQLDGPPSAAAGAAGVPLSGSGAELAAQAAYNAGLRGEDLVTAVAIAGRESGYNPSAHNPNRSTGDDSYGLWQINMLGDMGPARRAQLGISSNEELFDPINNARAMALLVEDGRRRGDPVYHWGGYRSEERRAGEGVGGRWT